MKWWTRYNTAQASGVFLALAGVAAAENVWVPGISFFVAGMILAHAATGGGEG